MRIPLSKLMLAVVCVPVVIALGAGRAAAPPPQGCNAHTSVFHLNISGTNLTLVNPLPTGATTKIRGLGRARPLGREPLQPDGEWEGFSGDGGCHVDFLSPLHAWLGLRNSDDQGTNFDLKAEVRVSNQLVATAEKTCSKGLSRNPAHAQDIVLSFPAPVPFVDEGEVTLTLYARIGTPRSTCGGHNAATGLRLYYGSDERDSLFDIAFNAEG